MTQIYDDRRTTEPLLNKRGAAALLGISLRSLDRLIATRTLPVVRIGGSVRVRPEDVRDLVERHREPLRIAGS
jgi:excisionase family DNA binding protein